MSRLIVRNSSGDKTYPLGPDLIRLGRSAENDIVIDDPGSSRYHCQLERRTDGYELVDLESRNGTLVNGRRQTERRVLEPGDRIEIGSTIIFFGRDPRPTEAAGRRTTNLSTAVMRREDLGLEPASPADETTSLRRSRKRKTRGERPADEPAPAERPAAAAATVPAEEELAESTVETAAPDSSDRSDAALRQIMQISKQLCSELDPERLLERIMDVAIELSGAERGFLILEERGEAGGDSELRIKISRNLDRESVQRADLKFSRSIAGQVIASGEAILTADATTDRRFGERHSVQKMRLRSVLSVPLRARERVIGAVYVDNRFERGVFTEEQRDLLEAVAGQAAIAIENARLFAENRRRAEELGRAKEEVERLNSYLRDENARQRSELEAVEALVEERRAEVQLTHDYSSIITRSPKMLTILSLVDKVTESSAPVLITGESGTGKELVARAVHFNGPRRKRPFVSENCAAIPSSLMESELFGHVKGAFTGALRDKKGLIEAADGGTLFLDEIGDMDVDVQTKLLRVLQSGEVRRVGSKEWRRVDVRITSATNRDLRQMIRDGTFREDLFYRLNVIGVVLPPLRERREDIPLLVDHFIRKVTEGRAAPSISPDVLEMLIRHSWPGNIRELENEIERACTLASERILPEHLSPALVAGAAPDNGSEDPEATDEALQSEQLLERLGRFEDGKFERRETLRDLVAAEVEDVEKRAIVEVLRRTRWTKSRAAAVLGISRPTLDAKIEKYALSKEEVLAGEP